MNKVMAIGAALGIVSKTNPESNISEQSVFA